jgi:hypothetical protein
MRRPSRFRRFAKWTGLASSALISGLWVTTLFWHVDYITNSFLLSSTYGRFYYIRYEGTLEDRRYFVRNYKRGGGWQVERVPLGDYRERDRLVSRLGFAWMATTKDGPYPFGPASIRQTGYVTPLWIPLAALLAMTALLWWMDRRRFPQGHCRNCGYNLTGNVSGVCPECGQKVSRACHSEGTK